MASPAIIDIQDAKLNTLTVEIKALTVSGKQMTLAVFRQLPQGTIAAEDGSLLDKRLWGTVRYDIKDEGSTWFVYDDGGVLYRARGPHKADTWNIKHEIAEVQRRKFRMPGQAERIQDLKGWLALDEQRNARVDRSWETLNALPQLFIAC